MALDIRTVGIIGAGQMGNGIAHVCAAAGLDVRLNDREADRIDAGLALIDSNLSRQVQKGSLTDEQRRSALGRIVPARGFQDLEPCDLVIEAATEDEVTKRQIFQALCPSLRPDALVATNTSSISITRLAASCCR